MEHLSATANAESDGDGREDGESDGDGDKDWDVDGVRLCSMAVHVPRHSLFKKGKFAVPMLLRFVCFGYLRRRIFYFMQNDTQDLCRFDVTAFQSFSDILQSS